MKKIAIVYRNNENETVINRLNEIVEDIFSEYAQVDTYYGNQLESTTRIDADVFLVIDRKLIEELRWHTDVLRNVVVMERSISQDQLKEILEIPKGSRVLVVNDTEENAKEMMNMLYELNIGHVFLIPYPTEETIDFSGIEYAITPDEVDIVPPQIKHIINTGYRLISFDAIFKVAEGLSLSSGEMKDVREKMISYADSIISPMREYKTSYLDGYLKSQMLNTYVADSSFAVLLADKNGRILYCNPKAEQVFLAKNDMRQYTTDDLPPQIKELMQGPEVFQQLVSIGHHNFIADKYDMKFGKMKAGFYLVLKDEAAITEMERSLNKKLVEKGLFAKHSFDDIKRGSQTMEECIQMAKSAAMTEHTVLLIGESGTGKELLAQAIHNYSRRKNRPFVGVNCAAIPENLLESELFGYVSGAFTGADKNGKIGFFERANHGTIFLDEIGDVSPSMQAKLLRVIQERQVIRIGSDRVIDLDLRIIAATNKDLQAQAEGGIFRKDLFYRLSVLQILVPALRERKGDITVLLEYFLQGDFYRLTKEEKNALKSYKWPGNIRELENCALYYKTMGKLPSAILRESALTSPLDLASRGEHQRQIVLQMLLDAEACGQGMGRQNLLEHFKKSGQKISDVSLRKIIEGLKNEGLIEVHIGRSGMHITPEGCQYLKDKA